MDIKETFRSMLIDSHEPLQNLSRSKCQKCGASRMYFCYTCYMYATNVDVSLMPVVKLPFKIDIIKHQKELDGKSTAVHAALMAPEDVKIYTYPIIPNYDDNTTVLVFPGNNSINTNSFFSSFSKQSSSADKTLEVESLKVIFIDSTWNQVHSIITDERISNIQTVRLTSQKTTYWRKQHNVPDTYLATIEAIHLFLKEYHESMIGHYKGVYDNLLYFYSYFYNMVHANGKNRK